MQQPEHAPGTHTHTEVNMGIKLALQPFNAHRRNLRELTHTLLLHPLGR